MKTVLTTLFAAIAIAVFAQSSQATAADCVYVEDHLDGPSYICCANGYCKSYPAN